MQRLLQAVKEDLDKAQPRKYNATPVLYLNCRGKDVASPQGFANAIRELITNDDGLQEWWKKNVKSLQVGASVKGAGNQLKLDVVFAPAPNKSPMASIIDSLTAFLEATRDLPENPVIIIDEANKLMRWGDDPGNKQLKDLLDFFVKTTKEDHLGHIVLASSESFVINFLEKGNLGKCLLVVDVLIEPTCLCI